MKTSTKAIFLSLLLVLLHAQTSSSGIYTIGSQTYQTIVGDGAPSASNLGDRPADTAATFNPDSSYTPPVTNSKPQQINCPANQVYNNILCECVCVVGYYWNSGKCIPFDPYNPVCNRNEVYRDKRCVCDYGYDRIGTVCDVCPPYSTYDIHTLSCYCITGYEFVPGNYGEPGQCLKVWTPPPQPPPVVIPECGLNEVLVNNICQCRTGFYLIKGVCTFCATPNYYDAQLAICRPKCGTNEQLDLGTLKCICLAGYQLIDGVCGTCPAYAIYNNYKKTCDCIKNYVFNSGKCVPDAKIPVTPPTLPVPPRFCQDLNAVEINGQCVCRADFHLINGVCQRCPSNTFYDPDLAICRISCNANEVYNILTAQCDCGQSFFRINGVCKQCGGGSTFDPIKLTCVCPSGYRMDTAGNCVVGCGVNEILKDGQCCCKVGFYPVNGICGQCLWNEIYDQGLGICRIPCDNTRIFDISQKKCVCLPHLYEMKDGTCETCVVHSTYSSITKECHCDAGYIKNLGLCTPSCNPYENYVNGNCVCKEGYYLIGYSCGICPPTEVYDSTYRICHAPCSNNEVWDPIIRACRCLPGFYLINNVCSQCDPRTQVYNHRIGCCDCIEGYKKRSGQGCQGVCTPICSENEDFILSRCVCKPGFYLINNYCTRCPEGQTYDIYNRVCRIRCGPNQLYNFNSGKCDCAAGYYIVQGICSQCLTGETYNQYKQTCETVPCPGVNEYFSETTYTCLCKPEYVRIRGVCTNCNPGQYYDSYSDRCLCKPGYTEYQGMCKAQCPTGSTYQNGKCICDNGMPVYNGECRVPNICPLYAFYDKRAECCVCQPGYRVINGKCSSYQYCGVNGYLKYGQCYCNDGYYWILGACRRCGPNEAFNGVACECFLGYHRDVNGNCQKIDVIPNCYENERYDTALKACVCVAGTEYHRGRCVVVPQCPANSHFDSLSCVCDTGFQMGANNQCVSTNLPVPQCPTNSFFNGVSCTCNIGVFQQDINACAACPAGTQWDGRICAANNAPQTCAAGWIFNSNIGQCEPSAPSCGDNAFFNGATCVCLTGFNFINGVCQSCPAGTVFDGAQCSNTEKVPAVSCGSNQVVSNGVCVCNSGLHMINGECLGCPAYTTWNGQYCQCGCDTSAWCLGQAFSQWNSTDKVCECQSGYTRVNGICQA